MHRNPPGGSFTLCHLHGRKLIYDGDKCRSVVSGDLFYLGIGHHYVANLADERQPFEQIVFYYSPEQLQRILRYLTITYRLTVDSRHSCDVCRLQNAFAMPLGCAARFLQQYGLLFARG